MPPGAWDSHVHVVNEEEFPFDEQHPFRPKKADLDDLLEFEKGLGIDHVALVAISVYGNDNRLLLDRLRKLDGRGRGVVSIEPTLISDAELQDMHSIGVRGARINLLSRLQKRDKDSMVQLLETYSARLRHLKWSLHLHVGLEAIQDIYDIIPSLGVDVVIDHMATPPRVSEPNLQPGYKELMDLLERRLVYIKLSGLYRLKHVQGLHKYIKDVLNIAPTQVIWASDWPHTGGAKSNPDGDRTKLQDYRDVDVPAFIRDCWAWCQEDENLMRQILVDNPRQLWNYKE